MKICIIGSGNISHALIGCMGNLKSLDINVYSNNNLTFKEIEVLGCLDKKTKGVVATYSNNPIESVKGSDVIIFTIPSFLRKKVLQEISPFISKNTIIGSFPGNNGFNIEVNNFIKNNPIIFSTQRVPFIARIIERGKSVKITKKESISVAITQGYEKIVRDLLTSLLSINVKILSSFMEVNLSNSNPILHSARLYTLFKNYNKNKYWTNNILFYEDWDYESSKLLLSMDEEFMKIVNTLNLKGIKPLKQHYGVHNANEMTTKLSSIEAFKGIYSPMVLSDKGYIPDFNSRYFLEDISYGLFYIQQVAISLGIKTPNIDDVINWTKPWIPEKNNWLDISDVFTIFAH